MLTYKNWLENIKLSSDKYKKGLLEAARSPLEQALDFNPEQVWVNQLLADILLVQGEAGEAREILEKLYQSQPAAARSRLIQALLLLAKACDNENDQLELYKQIFELDAEQLEAKSAWQKILQQRADEAYKSGDLETALIDYRTANLDDKVAELEKEIQQRDIEMRLNVVNKKAQTNRYQKALEQVQQLTEEISTSRQQETALTRLLDEEKKVRANAEKELTDSQKQAQALIGHLEREKNALAKAKNELSQLLDKEKEALHHAQNELKNRELHETEAKSQFHQKEAELIQSLDEEKEVRAKNEQKLKEITLIQSLDKERDVYNAKRLALDKDEILHQSKQEIPQLKKELESKKQALHHVENELQKSRQREKELTQLGLVNEKNAQKQTEMILTQIREHEKQPVNNRFWFPVGTFMLVMILIILVSWQFYLNTQHKTLPIQEVVVPKEIVTEPIAKPVIEPIVEPVTTVALTTPITSAQKICVLFKERAWLRITNKSGERILHEGISNMGEILSLNGTPPFYMKVGNIGGVYIEEECDINKITAYPKQAEQNNTFIIGNNE
ncbi:MAG: hypothetical protein DRQ41_05380 [Gammaproteobacteria bacterium]|nr:MAG: hypothetical protein DRQ41_05380 [Gammaproteobacteria bacterium]